VLEACLCDHSGDTRRQVFGSGRTGGCDGFEKDVAFRWFLLEDVGCEGASRYPSIMVLGYEWWQSGNMKWEA